MTIQMNPTTFDPDIPDLRVIANINSPASHTPNTYFASGESKLEEVD